MLGCRHRLGLILAVMLFLPQSRPRADVLIDNFTDNDAFAIWDGEGVWVDLGSAPPLTEKTTRFRTLAPPSYLGTSPGFGDISLGRFQGTDLTHPALFPGISNSTNATFKMEAFGVNCVRGSGYDASGLNYIRFKAWRAADDIPNRRYLQPNTQFVVGFSSLGGDFGQLASVGPLTAGAVTGFTLTLPPQDFLVSFSSLGVDPVVQAMLDTAGLTMGPADRAILNILNFSYRHEGVNLDTHGNTSLFLCPDFFVDDVILTVNPPGFTVSAPDTQLDEAVGGDTVTLSIVLDAMPTDDVIISAGSDDVTEGTIAAPSSITFTQANWDTPQPIVVQVVDEFIDDGDVNFNVFYTVSTADLLYGAIPLPSTGVTTVDNDTLDLVVEPGTLVVPEGGTASFGVSLGADPLGSVSVAVSFSSGDADLSVFSGAALSFDSLNWNVPQPVTIAAAQDGDQANGTADFDLQATGAFTSLKVKQTREQDDDATPSPSPTATLSPTPTSTDTPTASPTETETATPSATATASPSAGPNAAQRWALYE